MVMMQMRQHAAESSSVMRQTDAEYLPHTTLVKLCSHRLHRNLRCLTSQNHRRYKNEVTAVLEKKESNLVIMWDMSTSADQTRLRSDT